jgi:nitroreductase
VKVPTPVLHRLAEKQLFAAYAMPSVHNIHFCGFGVRPGRYNRKAAVVMTI